MPCRTLSAFLASTLAIIAPALADGTSISLAGTWRLSPDPDASGQGAVRELGLTDAADVWLPGAMQAQGFGDLPTANSPWVGDTRPEEWARPEYADYLPDDNFKMPFWLTPERVFVGAVWYSREVTIPAAWQGQHITLHLERAKWITEAYLDGEPLGKHESLSTPHVYDLGVVEPGTYTLDLRVDNSMAYGVGPNAHSMTDHTQTNWNGVVGDIQLQASPLVSVEQVLVVPSAKSRSALATVTIVNRTKKAARVSLNATAKNHAAPTASAAATLSVPANGKATADINIDLGDDAALWGEFTPNAYTLHIDATTDHGTDRFETWFGLRDLSRVDGRFAINGQPIYLRGTLECAIFPKTGFPPTDVAEWERIFNRLREFGLNHMRFHSWCPPRAAFLAADRIGMYLQVEGPFWVNQGPQLGRGQPIDQYVMDETDRILAEFGNHPSFMLMAYGNEPSGPGPNNQGENYLARWLNKYKLEDPRRYYTSGAGWPLMDESQYHVPYQPRIQRWGEGLNSTINSKPPSTRRDYDDYAARFEEPILAHEIGQWCVFPNFEEMGKYTGHLKPKNFEIFRDLLEKNGLGHRSRDFLMASGRLQVLAYKEDIEAALRTNDFGGFQLLDLHDFPGQGTALVGVLDPFWDPKPYITADEWTAFCSPIVPLARFENRVFTNGSTLTADIEIAHFGPADINNATVTWTIDHENGTPLAAGSFAPMDLPTGNLISVGPISAQLSVERAAKATLRVAIEGHGIANTWDIWVMPSAAPKAMPGSVHVTTELDAEAERVLGSGGTVLLTPESRFVKGDVAFGFSPVFWNTAWTDGQAPHTLGLRVDPAHPLFADFPTDTHSDWQWWDLIGWPGAQAGAMVINDLPPELEPLVQPIDTWFRSRRLASMFEARVGEGRLLVSTMDVQTDLPGRHAARQLRSSLIDYMSSAAFDPKVEVSPDDIRALFREPSVLERVGAVPGDASPHQRGYPPTNALDGNPTTLWHTAWSEDVTPHPHTFTIQMDEPQTITGLVYTPRQDGNINGKIDRYRVHTSADGQTWTPAAEGRFTAGSERQPVRFSQPTPAAFVRLTAISAHRGGTHSAIADLDLLTD